MLLLCAWTTKVSVSSTGRNDGRRREEKWRRRRVNVWQMTDPQIPSSRLRGSDGGGFSGVQTSEHLQLYPSSRPQAGPAHYNTGRKDREERKNEDEIRPAIHEDCPRVLI